MKLIQKIVVGIGILDITYIAWIGLGIWKDSDQLNQLWESILSFGIPYPELQYFAVLFFYISIIVSGITLILLKNKLAWVNYVQFPLRVITVTPTLFPIYILLNKVGVNLGIPLTFATLFLTEMVRVYVIYRWNREL